jgi:hypothetical protein
MTRSFMLHASGVFDVCFPGASRPPATRMLPEKTRQQAREVLECSLMRIGCMRPKIMTQRTAASSFEIYRSR